MDMHTRTVQCFLSKMHGPYIQFHPLQPHTLPFQLYMSCSLPDSQHPTNPMSEYPPTPSKQERAKTCLAHDVARDLRSGRVGGRHRVAVAVPGGPTLVTRVACRVTCNQTVWHGSGGLDRVANWGNRKEKVAKGQQTAAGGG